MKKSVNSSEQEVTDLYRLRQLAESPDSADASTRSSYQLTLLSNVDFINGKPSVLCARGKETLIAWVTR